MISPAIAGNDSRCGIALRVFLGELSAISCQWIPDSHRWLTLPITRLCGNCRCGLFNEGSSKPEPLRRLVLHRLWISPHL
jgi:hypothetical protein